MSTPDFGGDIIISLPDPNPPIVISDIYPPVLLVEMGGLATGPKGDPGPQGPPGVQPPGFYTGHGLPPDDLPVTKGSTYLDLDDPEKSLYRLD
jgi:hypothetical protein